MKKLGTKFRTIAFAAMGLIGLANVASAQVTLPSTGVDVSEYATAALTAVAVVVGGCIGVKMALKVIRVALRWATGALYG